MPEKPNQTAIACRLETVSPVHVGCDDYYEPTSFVIDAEKCRLVIFDPLDFIVQLMDKDRELFTEICKEGKVSSILKIYKFIRKKESEGKVAKRGEIEVSADFLKHYGQTLDIRENDHKKILQELNRFAIARTAYRQSDNRAYIPGSAVKGALRTAYLNHVAGNTRVNEKRDAKKLEKGLLDYDRIETDPFRMVDVSDFQPVGDVPTKIVYAVNEKKKESKFDARGPYQILEVIDPASVFQGTIAVAQPLAGAEINRTISVEELFSSVLAFYATEKEREDRELTAAGLNPSPNITGRDTFGIRLGRHSGAESVTIDGYRNIKIMQGKGQKAFFSEHATTFWLTSNERKPNDMTRLKPFGWAKMTGVTSEQEQEFAERELSWRDRFRKDLQEQQNARRKAMQERMRLMEERKEAERRVAEQKAEQERKQREEKEKRIAEEKRIEKMTPEERDIETVQTADTEQEKDVNLIYQKFDSFPEDKKIELAAALREYWRRTGKWKGKQSTKQKAKVSKIKSLLGE